MAAALGLFIKNEKLFNSNNNRSKPEVLRLLWDIVAFQIWSAFVEYDLFNITNLMYKIITYKRFGIILTQFYMNISRQEHQIVV